MDSTTAPRDIKVSASMRLTLPFKGKQTEVKGFNVIVVTRQLMGKTTKCDVPILSNERVASALSLLGSHLDFKTSINREELAIFMIHKKQDKHSSICTIWNEDKEAALALNISIEREEACYLCDANTR